MLGFIAAHGFDPGPTQRPIVAGALSGALAALPAVAVLVGFGTFRAMAQQILHLSFVTTAVVLAGGFVLAGAIYGALLRRAANDRQGGWVFGTVYGLLLWVAAPVVVLPLLGRTAIAAGRAGEGFLVGFLLWGLVLGVIFRFVHRPFESGLDAHSGKPRGSFGPEAAARSAVSRWRSDD